MKLILGIDPGANGSISWIDARGAIQSRSVKHDAPIESLREVLTIAPAAQCTAFLERLGGFIAGRPLPGSSMYKMGHSAGYWEGMLVGLGIKTILVRPQEWQTGIPGAAAKKGPERKRALKAEAIRRFPAEKVTLANCDSMLMAEYGARRVFEGQAKAVEKRVTMPPVPVFNWKWFPPFGS